MRIWVDDTRPAPEGWTWIKSVDECIDCLSTGTVEILSLDNDLGYVFPESEDFDIIVAADGLAREGYEVVDWMVENEVWPRIVGVHSSNVVARQRMIQSIEKHGGYDRHFHVIFEPKFDGKRKNRITYPGVIYEKSND